MDEETYERWLDAREARLRQLGTRDPICRREDCDERDPFSLTGSEPDIICYEHQAEEAGRSWLEEQHSQGQHNGSEKDPVPGNDHRAWDAMKPFWPQDTLRNPNKSPLLRASATLRGFLDLLWLLVFRILGWIPSFLEELDAWLVAQYGAAWWIGFIADTGWEM